MSDPGGAIAPSRARASAARYIAPALILATVILRLPAFFSARHLVFDDGTYGVSVVDMRHGLAPYTGVFSAQGPLHFPLLYAGDLIGLRTLNGPRVTPLLAGILTTLAAWAIARRLAGEHAGLLAGVLVATSGSMIITTGQVTGDGPAAALAVGAVWAALAYRGDPRLRRALLTGLLIGAALAVKPLLLPAALPVGWWLWSHRRADHLAAAVGAAIALWFASALPWGLGNVWDQSVAYNSGAGPRFGKAAQLRKLFSTLGDRDLLVLGALILAVLTTVIVARRKDAGLASRAAPADVLVVAVWAIVTAAVLVLEPALYRNHLAAIVPPLAILTAVIVRPTRLLVLLLVILVPFATHNIRDLLAPTGYRGDEAALMQTLKSLPRDAWAISDDAGYVYRAGLRTPRLMNDPSVKRIDQHLLTTGSVARAASDPRVCAVVVWSTRFGRDLPGLPLALRRAGLVAADRYHGLRTLWLRPSCDPGGGRAHRSDGAAARVRSPR